MTARIIVGPLKLVTRKLTSEQWARVKAKATVKK